MEHETFWTLLGDAGHWEFEIFLMVLFDGVLGLLVWPFVKKHWAHHKAHDALHVGAVAPEANRPGSTKWRCFWGHTGKWEIVKVRAHIYLWDSEEHNEVRNGRVCARCGVTEVRPL